MQEKQITIEGTSHYLSPPFMTLATQNPIEQEGTYPLPEAQLDRFLLKVLIPYPTESEEKFMVSQVTRGQVGDSAELDEAERTVWRKQAIEWLRADLLLWARILESGRSGPGAALRQSLAHWLSDGDLADLRDEPAITRLSEREREECRAFWKEVETLLRRAQQKG